MDPAVKVRVLLIVLKYRFKPCLLKAAFKPCSQYDTIENHCTRTAQSLRGGYSRQVQKIVYLAVKNGNSSANILLAIYFYS